MQRAYLLHKANVFPDYKKANQSLTNKCRLPHEGYLTSSLIFVIMENNPPWIYQLIGWLHLVIIHFPIGLLFMGLLAMREKQEYLLENLQFSSNKKHKDSDSNLWANFKTGCLISYEQIYRENVKEMFNYGMTIVYNEAQVKDCIQELFFEIWKTRKNLSTTNNIRFYLLKSLRYKINHASVKEDKRRNLAYQSYSEENKILFPSDDESIRGKDLNTVKKQVEIALSKLSSREREVITLIFYEGMTYEEAANIMSISVGSIYTLAWKAISRLREIVI